jgi:cytochrome c-type biogenesis protein
MVDVTLSVAFVAGILSFFSPCIFPFIPGFLAYLAGLDLTARARVHYFNWLIFSNALAYVTGFIIVFTLLGFALSSILGTLSVTVRVWLTRASGVVILLFGLSLLGVFRIPFLEREHKPSIRRRASLFTSFLLGVTFALGWTPCFGAVLGGIVTLAFAQPSNAFALLLAYGTGLGIPFIVLGASYAGVARFVNRTAHYTRFISIALGVILVLVGLAILTNALGFSSLQNVFDSWFADRERALLDTVASANLA